MSILVTESWSATSSGKTATGWNAKRVFQVSGVTSAQDAEAEIRVIAPVNSTHPSNGLLLCAGYQTTGEGPQCWKTTVTYAWTPSGAFDDPASPLNDPVRFKWKFGSVTLQVDRDYQNNAIVNSAGDPFDSPVTQHFGTLFLTVRRNEPFFNVQTALSYQNYTNSAPFNPFGAGIVAPGQSRCVSVECDDELTTRQLFATVLYTFEFRADGFTARIVDQGMRALFVPNGGSGTTAGAVYDNAGNRLTHPVLLDGKGKPLDSNVYVGIPGGAGVDGTTPTGATVEAIAGPPTCTFLHYTTYKQADFNQLGLFY